MRPRSLPLLLVLSVLALLVAACTAIEDADVADRDEAGTVGEAPGDDMTDGSEADDAPEVTEAEQPVEAQEPGAAPDAADPGVSGDGETGLPPADAHPVRSGLERIIKEGTVVLEVDEGGFMAAYQRVVQTARRHGGSVTASTSSTDDAGRTTGSVTVRVPVDAYEDLLVGVGRVGTLREQDISSQDVTGEVVDLQARLRHLRAQEAFYLGLLDDATSVQEAIAVQQQVDGIQQRIEQLQGRLDQLEDRAAYSTLTVELIEAGAEPVVAAAEEPTLAAYALSARHGFVTVVGWLLVVGASLAPLVVPAVAALLVWRLTRHRGAQPGTVTVQAD